MTTEFLAYTTQLNHFDLSSEHDYPAHSMAFSGRLLSALTPRLAHVQHDRYPRIVFPCLHFLCYIPRPARRPCLQVQEEELADGNNPQGGVECPEAVAQYIDT
jgi:hypothetical protein